MAEPVHSSKYKSSLVVVKEIRKPPQYQHGLFGCLQRGSNGLGEVPLGEVSGLLCFLRSGSPFSYHSIHRLLRFILPVIQPLHSGERLTTDVLGGTRG